MKNDIDKAIETTASTNNEGNEEDSIPVEFVDKVERFEDGFGDKGTRFQTYWYRYQYNNKNRLHTKKDVAEAIETAASTNNEGNEKDSIFVELVDKEERFKDGYGDGELVSIRFWIKYKYNKNRLPTCCQGDRDRCTNNQWRKWRSYCLFDIVIEKERFEDGDRMERNGTTTSDNPIDTGKTTTTTKAKAGLCSA